MLYTTTPQQIAILNSLNSGCATSMENGIDTISVVDIATKKVWHKGTGATMQQAFDNAISTLNVSSKPKSQAEIALSAASLEDENNKLREQLAALQNALSKQPSKKTATTDNA